MASTHAPPALTLPEPAWSAPLDLDWYLEHVPAQLMVKGMSIQGVLDAALAQGRTVPWEGKLVAFKDYPMKTMVEALVRCARVGFPELPPREALRRLGWHQLAQLQSNLVFKVMFAGLGKSLGIQALVMMAPRAWGATNAHERVLVLKNEKGHVRMHLQDVWSFPDCFQVGIIEGALTSLGVAPRMGVMVRSPTEVELEAVW